MTIMGRRPFVAMLLGSASKQAMILAPLYVWMLDVVFVSGSWLGALRRAPRLYALLGLGIATAVFLRPGPVQRQERLVQVLDAVGLGAFTAGGGLLAIQRGFGEPFMVVAFGLLTGIGGGILRDVLTGEPPLVFRREIYASASLVGALLLVPLRRHLGPDPALYTCFGLVVSLRLFCVLKGIHMPVARKG